MVLSHTAEPQFSQPVRQIVMMLIVLGLTAALAVLIFPVVQEIFIASPYLKIFILLVFFIGVLACFWQVFTLIASVNWIEGFAIDRPGHEFTKPPRLLAPLAALLSGRRARRSLTSNSTRSILELVATRIEEQRDLTRYIINLLIFLGLLGTFYGLATVVPAVVNTIRSLAPQEGESAAQGFDALMQGLEGQLGGMGTAFGSSLLGLSGSLVVGLLELFASHAQNRFYRELEEWLSSITKIGVTGVDPEEALTAANVLTVIGQTAEHIDQLREVVEQGAARSAQTEARIGELAALLARRRRRRWTTRSWSASPPGRSGWRISWRRSRGRTGTTGCCWSGSPRRRSAWWPPSAPARRRAAAGSTRRRGRGCGRSTRRCCASSRISRPGGRIW